MPVPLRLCRGCRRFVRVDQQQHCVFCDADLDAADAEHEANVSVMRRAADRLRKALADRA